MDGSQCRGLRSQSAFVDTDRLEGLLDDFGCALEYLKESAVGIQQHAGDAEALVLDRATNEFESSFRKLGSPPACLRGACDSRPGNGHPLPPP